jgi:hypothetical protein
VWATGGDDRSGARLHDTGDDGRFRLEVPRGFRGSIGAALPGQWQRRTEVHEIDAGRTDVVITLPGK